MLLPRLMYIAHSVADVEMACQSGIQFIQLRIKDKLLAEVSVLAKEALAVTQDYQDIVLTINDYPQIVALGYKGVHLGQGDMDIDSARNLVGLNKIIGGTANDLVEVQGLYYDAVNYIGLGPYRETQTKKNLADTLGVEGYTRIMNHLKKIEGNQASIPVYAIGGILLEDVAALMQTDVYGIAVSGAINNAKNTKETVTQFKEEISKCIQKTP